MREERGETGRAETDCLLHHKAVKEGRKDSWSYGNYGSEILSSERNVSV